MQPVKFPECNITFGEGQPQYIPLPALVMPDGEAISCWELTDEELEVLRTTKRIWLSQLTFNEALQPQRPSVEQPFRKVVPT